MPVSNQWAFNPSGGELIFYSYSLIGIRRTALLQEHMVDARMALNLMFSAWGNSTPNLWTVDLVEVDLMPGVATYDVEPNTIMILDAYIRTGEEPEAVNDRIIWPISRTEYASTPNKLMQAPPTVFWFDRQLSPTITLWQVPDEQQPYKLRYYRCISIMDASQALGQNMDIPPLWLDAVAWGLASRLAVSYAPDKAIALDAKAKEALMEAREQNTEAVPFYVMPQIGGFWPR